MRVQIIGILCCTSVLWLIRTSHYILVLKLAFLGFRFGTGLYEANIWTSAFDVIDPVARATAAGLLNVISALLGNSWINPLIGKMNDYSLEQSGTLSTALGVSGSQCSNSGGDNCNGPEHETPAAIRLPRHAQAA